MTSVSSMETALLSFSRALKLRTDVLCMNLACKILGRSQKSTVLCMRLCSTKMVRCMTVAENLPSSVHRLFSTGPDDMIEYMLLVAAWLRSILSNSSHDMPQKSSWHGKGLFKSQMPSTVERLRWISARHSSTKGSCQLNSKRIYQKRVRIRTPRAADKPSFFFEFEEALIVFCRDTWRGLVPCFGRKR